MLRFLVYLGGWIFVLLAMLLISSLAQWQEKVKQPDLADSFEQLQGDFLQERVMLENANKAYLAREYLSALALLESQQSHFEQLSLQQPRLAYPYFLLKGMVHASLWQYVESEQSWQQAIRLTKDEQQRQRITRLLTASQYMLDDMNSERTLRNIYYASPDVGPAARLNGRIAVVYIFLTDGALQGWSLRKRDFVMNNWSVVEQWLRQNSASYHSQLSFVQRVFLVDKNPYIKRLRVGDFDHQFQHADKVARLAANGLGFPTIAQFVQSIKQQERADQVIVLFHLARDGRSFASRCVVRCKADSEYVFLMESAMQKNWQSLGYAQAHEVLHLFGADDLYNIRSAKNFALRDIMNYPASILAASRIEPITAYATGLQRHMPTAPFRIQTSRPRY